MPSLTYTDETATGRELHRWTVPDLPERISVREMVRLRVREEVARHNAGTAPQVFQGLVQPRETEATATGFRFSRPRKLDWEEQADVAETAFTSNGYFILVDDHQVETLDEVVDLTTDPHVAFVKLVALVGG